MTSPSNEELVDMLGRAAWMTNFVSEGVGASVWEHLTADAKRPWREIGAACLAAMPEQISEQL